MITIYLHYNSLRAFDKGDWVNAKLQFIGQDDVEVLLNIEDIIISYQQNGFTVRKRRWYEKLPFIKSIR